MAEFEFNAVLDAIGSYYGTGSDQWVEFAQYGLMSDNLYETLRAVPDVDVVTSNSGRVLGATVSKNFSGVSAGAAGAIDSNLQVPTQGSGTTFSGKIPMNGTYNQTTGVAEMTSGAKAATGGATVATVLDKVALGVAGVSLGAKLGAWIDRNLYEANPDWWDAHFPSINPSTWNSIAKTENGKNFLSSLFGISEINGKKTGTMYLDEEALAYLAYGMAQNGMFSSGNSETIDTTNLPGVDSTIYNNIPCSANGPTMQHTLYGTLQFQVRNNSQPVYFSVGHTADGTYYMFMASNASFQYTYYAGRSPQWLSASSGRYQGHTIYSSGARYDDSYVTSIAGPVFSIPAGGSINDTFYGYIMLYGTHVQTPTIPGTQKQPGATFPDTSGWSDPTATLNSLKSAHPDWWSSGLTMDVPQPDGTTQRYNYVPIPITGTTGADDSDPTNTTITQGDTGTVDDTKTTDLINTLIRYITNTRTDTPTETPTPPDTPNPDPTGDGSTPPVVAPTGQASALFAVYNPTQAALNSFGAWLWSSNFIDQVLKLFNNPMQSIIGLHKIFAAPPISGSGTIRVGYLDSGVGSNLVGSQYTTINCGTVRVREQYGNVFDYTDTHIRLYLPFIGIVPLDTADVMRGAVSVVYHVDVITGACLAEVKVSRDGGGGTLYQYAGDAAVRYPISSGSYMGVVSGVLGIVGGIASAVMTGGASAPLAAGAVASGIANAKTDVQHSGSFAGNAGAMGGKKPYIIIERPQTAIADGYSAYQGTGANTIKRVGAMSGYFRMTDVHVDNVARASAEELEQIRTMIERGVIQ